MSRFHKGSTIKNDLAVLTNTLNSIPDLSLELYVAAFSLAHNLIRKIPIGKRAEFLNELVDILKSHEESDAVSIKNRLMALEQKYKIPPALYRSPSRNFEE